jgi:hypothetical protein
MSATPRWTKDLHATEKLFLVAIDQLAFGRFENVPIKDGLLVLDPWPATVRAVKFGAESTPRPKAMDHEFELSRPMVEFFEYVRSVDVGAISRLEIRHSAPFSLEISFRPDAGGVERA